MAKKSKKTAIPKSRSGKFDQLMARWRKPGEDVSNRPSADQPDATFQEDQGVLTDFMAVDPVQMEFDLDVQSIPRTPASETGAAQRAIKENLEEAKGLIEIGKPGSPFENGIKDPKQLIAVLTAIGLVDKMFIASSRAEMGRIAKKFGRSLGSNTQGLWGLCHSRQHYWKDKCYCRSTARQEVVRYRLKIVNF